MDNNIDYYNINFKNKNHKVEGLKIFRVILTSHDEIINETYYKYITSHGEWDIELSKSKERGYITQNIENFNEDLLEDTWKFASKSEGKIKVFQKVNKVNSVTKCKTNITHEYRILYPNNPKELTRKEYCAEYWNHV